MKDEGELIEIPGPGTTDGTEEQDETGHPDSYPQADGKEPGSDSPLHGQTDEQPMAEGIFTSRRQRESSPEDVWKRDGRGFAGASSVDIIRRIERLESWLATNRA